MLHHLSSDPHAQLIFTTDAFYSAVGAVLHQQVNNQLQPLAFFSQNLQPAQTRYSTFSRELLAVYLAIRHFHNDHIPLAYALKAKPDRLFVQPLFASHAVSPFHPIGALTFNLTVNAPVSYPNYLTSNRHRLIMSNDSTSQPIAGIHTFDLPSVWLDDITLGLRTVESRFALRQITRENTKFHYVVAALPMDIATNLRDVIDCPATEAPYTALKEALISRISLSTQKRLQRLISEKDFGDRKPTQLLRTYRALPQDILYLRGVTYEQRMGTAMGSPISGLITEAVLQKREKQLFEEYKPKFWARYVDDTFVIIDQNKINYYEELLNSIIADLQFTAEEEVDDKLGSVLGPLLFLVYINDCANDLGCSAIMFADDVKLWRAIKSDADRYAPQDSRNRLNSWSARWLLNFNVDKCVVLRLRTKKTNKEDDSFQYVLGGQPLSNVVEQKDLGVLMTSSLKPSSQCQRAAKGSYELSADALATFDKVKAALADAAHLTHFTLGAPISLMVDASNVTSNFDCSTAELVLGAIVRLPGEMIWPIPRGAIEDPANLLRRLRQFIRTLSPVRPRPSVSESYLEKDMAKCSQVSLRCDRDRQPLEPTYDGLYWVISIGTKKLRIHHGTREEVLSVDLFKATVPDTPPEAPCGPLYPVPPPQPSIPHPVYSLFPCLRPSTATAFSSTSNTLAARYTHHSPGPPVYITPSGRHVLFPDRLVTHAF
ncbi:hypothetical protein SprV_0401709900 [Sparganum proliferum]